MYIVKVPGFSIVKVPGFSIVKVSGFSIVKVPGFSIVKVPEVHREKKTNPMSSPDLRTTERVYGLGRRPQSTCLTPLISSSRAFSLAILSGVVGWVLKRLISPLAFLLPRGLEIHTLSYEGLS